MTVRQLTDAQPCQRAGENHTATAASLIRQPAQPSLFEVPAIGAEEAADTSPDRLVKRSVESLKPHPALVRLGPLPTLEQILALEKIGEGLFERALLITQNNLIIDGLGCWQLAVKQSRATLLCQEVLAGEEEALYRILQLERRPKGLNGFSRVQLALVLEPWLRERALANQVRERVKYSRGCHERNSPSARISGRTDP